MVVSWRTAFCNILAASARILFVKCFFGCFCSFAFSNLRRVHGFWPSPGGPNDARCCCVICFLMSDSLSGARAKHDFVSSAINGVATVLLQRNNCFVPANTRKTHPPVDDTGSNDVINKYVVIYLRPSFLSPCPIKRSLCI